MASFFKVPEQADNREGVRDGEQKKEQISQDLTGGSQLWMKSQIMAWVAAKGGDRRERRMKCASGSQAGGSLTSGV